MAVDRPITEAAGEGVLASPYLAATSADYVAARRRRALWLSGGAAFISLLLGTAMLIANGNVILPVALLVVVGLVGLMVQFPKAMLPLTLLSTCLFEQYALNFPDSLTDRVPLFWDVNTVVQVYGHKDFHAMPFSLFEVLFVLALASWVIRGIYDRTLKITWESLALPILGYIVCVSYGLAYGITTGGDYHIALFEARPQFYLFFAYLMAVGSGAPAKKQFRAMLWITALCVGFKSILLCVRFFVTLGGHTTPEIGVGSHEESFFLSAFIVMLGVLWLAGIEPRLQKIMLVLLPIVLIAFLANERRAATAALVMAVPVMLGLGYCAFANRRRLIVGVVIAIAAVSLVYFPAYWNKDGVLAQPARAIKSEFSPDPRDQSSDLYRQAEDANLMYTMRMSPIYGYGYGKPIILFAPMVNLTDIDPLIMYRTHDQILWVWMRLGSIGFFFFWIMVAAILMRCAQVARFCPPGAVQDLRFQRQKEAAAVYVASLTVMLLVFGLYDMQLSSVRDMLFTGFWLGMFCAFLAQEKAAEPAFRPLARGAAFKSPQAAAPSLPGREPASVPRIGRASALPGEGRPW